MPKGVYNRDQVKVLVKCDWCGKELERVPSRIKKVKNNFCSLECRSKWHKKFYISPCRGDKSSNWKGGRGKHYARIVTRRQGRILCEYVENGIVCCYKKRVEVHHIDGNQDNNDPKNLLVLCRKHHRQIEGLDEMPRNEKGQFTKREVMSC